MSKERSLLMMAEAMAKMQWNIAMILEAKAIEAEKKRNWVLNHLTQQSFTTDKEQLSDSLEVHDQVIEMIEGLTKLQQSLSRNMKALTKGSNNVSGEHGFPDGAFGGEFDLGDN
ncbi:restriction endonuclease subunit S [Paenibacillus sp. 481]|uniref:restriction endonuclease subunit S n=1 Tax=Paenibacillus sp. 481 TaxID=2835869 RepID=UPI001E5E97B9|nr:restriction endonuclease subunit S [Paenibacillus sp. 481]UHA74507.1 restriction endonuclease subunit S [Paenibacillus sp. 481]